MESLSLSQARKLALLSQGLPTSTQKGSAYEKTLNVFEQLGYVQIDTISVVQRAHHHTLWSRNLSYQPHHLEQLVANKKVFEYWSHAAAYLPMKHYRYTLPRKAAIKSGEQRHWYCKDRQLMRSVLRRIEEEGPLMAKDFESKVNKTDGWNTKPTKRALENLYMQGDLMIAERRGFQKVYDLTARVLPLETETTMPTAQEYGRFLVMSYLNAHGFGSLAEMVYQLKDVRGMVKQALHDLEAMQKITKVKIGSGEYYVCIKALELVNKRLNRKRAKILSPFDNLLIQRKRASGIFNFDYLIECYVPKEKRQFGYFCLPILWNGQLVARADCKVDKNHSRLDVLHLFTEANLKDKATFLTALEQELQAFAIFNQCHNFAIHNHSENVS